MSTNPLRLAALVQGYPVRPPLNLAAAGDLKLWYDISDTSNTTIVGSSLTAITDKSGNHGLRSIQTTGSVTATISQQAGRNVAALSSDGQTRTVITFTSTLADFNFLHQTPAHVFAVLKSPSHPVSGMRRIRIGTAGFHYDRGFLVDVWDDGSESQSSVTSIIGRGSSVSRVATVDERAIWSPETWGVVHVATDPTTSVYADRLIVTFNGQQYSSTIGTDSVSASDSNVTGRIWVNAAGGSLAELLIYDGSLTVPAATVVSFLSAKWGIS